MSDTTKKQRDSGQKHAQTNKKIEQILFSYFRKNATEYDSKWAWEGRRRRCRMVTIMMNELLDDKCRVCQVYVYVMSMSVSCLCLCHVYVCVMSMSMSCLCLCHVYVCCTISVYPMNPTVRIVVSPPKTMAV